MKTTKWLTCVLLGFVMTMPMAEIMVSSARAHENEVASEATSALHANRRDRHNRQWRKAKLRAHEAARHGNARALLRDFRRELNDRDIVVNVCVINVINKAENVVAIGGDVNQVINIIDSANCEIR